MELIDKQKLLEGFEAKIRYYEMCRSEAKENHVRTLYEHKIDAINVMMRDVEKDTFDDHSAQAEINHLIQQNGQVGGELVRTQMELQAGQEEIAKLEKQRQVAISVAEEFEVRAIQAEQERYLYKHTFRDSMLERDEIIKELLEGLKRIANEPIPDVDTIPVEMLYELTLIARSIIAKIEGSNPQSNS